MSMVGRIVLTKFVLVSTLVYSLQSTLLLVTLCDKIDKKSENLFREAFNTKNEHTY